MTHLKSLQKSLKDKNVGGALVLSEKHVKYITGFDFTDGAVLVLQNKAYLLTDSRYIEAAKAKVDGKLFDIRIPSKKLYLEINDLLKDNSVSDLLIEENYIPLGTYERISGIINNAKLSSGLSEMLESLRICKDQDEIDAMQKAQDIADKAFAHILNFIKPDMTEIDVALELEFFMRKNGATGTSFETIAVSGKASSLPHGVPRNVKLEKGLFTMDFGAMVDGYCSDMTRTVVLGKADADVKKLYNTVLKAQLAGVEGVKEGAVCKEVDKIARDIIYSAGYEGCFGHSLGHGVGIFIHEAPNLSPAAPEGKKLVAGNIVTVEPGIYIEGKYGCRIEDMVLVTKDGCMNFAHSPKEMIELF